MNNKQIYEAICNLVREFDACVSTASSRQAEDVIANPEYFLNVDELTNPYREFYSTAAKLLHELYDPTYKNIDELRIKYGSVHYLRSEFVFVVPGIITLNEDAGYSYRLAIRPSDKANGYAIYDLFKIYRIKFRKSDTAKAIWGPDVIETAGTRFSWDAKAGEIVGCTDKEICRIEAHRIAEEMN